jgi:integrase
MLTVLPPLEKALACTAAFTGVRRGELRGLRWENLRDGELWVKHSVWENVIGEPKRQKSKAPVPVIKQLSDVLEEHRLASGGPTEGFISPTAKVDH